MVRDQEGNMRTIGQLAKSGGVGVETIRFYQRKGLLRTPSRDGGVRRYDEEELRRLRFIRKAQTAGFSLEEIGELLALDAGQDHARARELAVNRIARLDEQIAEMSRARDSLTRLARDCAGDPAGPCPILAAFEV
ncbi:MerR family transcriptional regulator [Marinicauda pacifica]|uniref:MerR family transcriptional regulator n=1 Tax=Marinicauda pacifica TaxID=1133559 RepID=UPI0035C7C480